MMEEEEWTPQEVAIMLRAWREAFQQEMPLEIRPLTWDDVEQPRTENDARAFIARMQVEQTLYVTTNLQQGDPSRGQERSHWNANDLNSTIFHDERDFYHYPEDALVFLTYHEIGHSRYYPATPARRIVGEALVKQLDEHGLWTHNTVNQTPAAFLFLNVLGDQIINNKTQYDPRRGDQFHRGMKWLLSRTTQRRLSPDTSWVMQYHFRLMWASLLLKQGHYWKTSTEAHLDDPGDATKVPLSDVSKIPPLLRVDASYVAPMVTKPNPRFPPLEEGRRLPRIWRLIQNTHVTEIESIFPELLSLSEPFFFPPAPPKPQAQTRKDNPKGLACPVCGSRDKFRLVGTVSDPENPKATLPRYQCGACNQHESVPGVYVIDPEHGQSRRTFAGNA